MGQTAYEMLSMGMRYVFTFLVALLFVRAALMMWRGRRDRHRVLRHLPDAGLVGELVTLSDGKGYPLAREGVLGSGRGCDIRLPGLRRREMEFAFQPGQGLLLRPMHGRVQAALDGGALTRRNNAALHGTVLEIRGMAMRFRLFAGLKVPERKARPRPEPLPGEQPPAVAPAPQSPWDMTWQYAPAPPGSVQGIGWDAGIPGADDPWAAAPVPPPVWQNEAPAQGYQEDIPAPDYHLEYPPEPRADFIDTADAFTPQSDDPLYPADCYPQDAGYPDIPADLSDPMREDEPAEDETPRFAVFLPDEPEPEPNSSDGNIPAAQPMRRRRAGRNGA